MENNLAVLKALANETRIKLLEVLLRRKYCVRALARQLEMTDAAISQHVKILREAGLLSGEKRGYFMHYEVDREQLRILSKEIDAFSHVEGEACDHEENRPVHKAQVEGHVLASAKQCTRKSCSACHPKPAG